jgi:hypothetical protein
MSYDEQAGIQVTGDKKSGIPTRRSIGMAQIVNGGRVALIRNGGPATPAAIARSDPPVKPVDLRGNPTQYAASDCRFVALHPQ